MPVNSGVRFLVSEVQDFTANDVLHVVSGRLRRHSKQADQALGFLVDSWALLEALVARFVEQLPEDMKQTLHLRLIDSHGISPEVRAFPGGLYRILFPAQMVVEILDAVDEFCSPGKDCLASDRLTKLCLMLCLGHEMIHCVRGHFEVVPPASPRAEETDADFLAGGLIWGWLSNQPKLLCQHGLPPCIHDAAYEYAQAAVLISAIFQRHAKDSRRYHLPRQRLLLLLAGCLNPVLQTEGESTAFDIGQKFQSGVEAAKRRLVGHTLEEHSVQLFANPANDEDLEELSNRTKRELDSSVPNWHRSSFYLEPVRPFLKEI